MVEVKNTIHFAERLIVVQKAFLRPVDTFLVFINLVSLDLLQTQIILSFTLTVVLN